MTHSDPTGRGADAGWRKVWRYLRLYGLGRVFFKVAGRSRVLAQLGRIVRPRYRLPDVGMIGCGQFAFATIGYVLTMRFGRRFARCYDVSEQAARTFADFYSIDQPSAQADAAIEAADVRYLYIASNHASHAGYATAALSAGKIVFVEKPIAVSEDQLRQLLAIVRSTGGKIYAGYNRPFSAAVRQLRAHCLHAQGPLTLCCFINGHQLSEGHWYRLPDEGTRICGNVGHWLDLAVHMLSWAELPDCWDITVVWSDERARDDNLAVSLTSRRGDLISIVLTARSEPFEGINETINLQWGTVIAKIDDFRRMEVWDRMQHRVYKYWPKDVGHRGAILQPFEGEGRAWREVELSSMLMLRITRMVRTGERLASFSFEEERARTESPDEKHRAAQSVS